MKRSFKRLPLFFTAFFLTLLLAVGMAASLVALVRMESATRPQEYTLFSLHEEGETLTLLLFNTQTQWDLAPAKRMVQWIHRIAPLLPVEWRSVLLLAGRVEAGFTDFWESILA